MIKLKHIVNEKFYDIAKSVGKDKGDWLDLERNPIKKKVEMDFPTRKNIFDLVDNAYRSALGKPHVGVKSPDDVIGKEYDYWEAIDINNDPEADAVLFGKSRHGVKISGIGHNGEMMAKNEVIKFIVSQLHKNGYWVEASSPIADILKFKGAPIFTDREKIQKIFSDSEFTKWYDDGSYNRIINNKLRNSSAREYIFGYPKI